GGLGRALRLFAGTRGGVEPRGDLLLGDLDGHVPFALLFDLHEMDAERRLDGLRDRAGREIEGHGVELGGHATASPEAEVSALRGALGVFGVLRGDLGELGAAEDPGAEELRLLAGGGHLLFARGAEEDVTG